MNEKIQYSNSKKYQNEINNVKDKYFGETNLDLNNSTKKFLLDFLKKENIN